MGATEIPSDEVSHGVLCGVSQAGFQGGSFEVSHDGVNDGVHDGVHDGEHDGEHAPPRDLQANAMLHHETSTG